jgi:hypothetical protein
MASLDGLKTDTQHERMEMAVRAILREGRWSEVEMIRLLGTQPHYLRSHKFATLQTEAVKTLLLGHRCVPQLFDTTCLTNTPNSQDWYVSPQLSAYRTREPGFENWNFIQFTLATAETNDYGINHPVSNHTLMLRLLGEVPAYDDESCEALALRLGLMRPWRTKSDIIDQTQNWGDTWDVFQHCYLDRGFAAE